MSATAAVFLLAIILFALGAALLPARSATVLAKVPRARGAAIALTCLCMAWATWTLYVHPIDFLSFLTPTTLIVGGLILTPLICIYLDNLLFARALGGIMMLWPMPVILLTRDYLTTWRLVPITLGYISLTLGMIIVFHPWTFSCACEALAEDPKKRLNVAALLLLAGLLCGVAPLFFGKVLGQ